MQSGRCRRGGPGSVAEATIHTTPALTVEAAGWVDAQVAAVAGRIGPAQLDRLVAETIKRFDLAAADPAADPEDGYLSVDPRHATLNDEDVHFAGTMHFEADLDLADALDLDRALAHGAETQKALGSTESLDARRAAALGDLARTQTALDLTPRASGSPRRRRTGCRPRARSSSTPTSTPIDRRRADGVRSHRPLEEGQRLVLLDQVKAWCGDSRTKVTIKPVIDLNAELDPPGYEIPDRIREQVILRDRTCVFPWCTRPARGCDVDHIVEYDHDADAEGRPQPGPTDDVEPRPRCAGSTTGSRPSPPGTTAWSRPGSSSGPAPTATATDATAPAPPASTSPTSRPTDHDPAPTSPAMRWRGHRHVRVGAINAPGPQRGMTTGVSDARRHPLEGAVHLGVVHGIGVAVDAHQPDEPRPGRGRRGDRAPRRSGPTCGWRRCQQRRRSYPVAPHPAHGRETSVPAVEVLDLASACASRACSAFAGLVRCAPTGAAVVPGADVPGRSA